MNNRNPSLATVNLSRSRNMVYNGSIWIYHVRYRETEVDNTHTHIWYIHIHIYVFIQFSISQLVFLTVYQSTVVHVINITQSITINTLLLMRKWFWRRIPCEKTNILVFTSKPKNTTALWFVLNCWKTIKPIDKQCLYFFQVLLV